MKGTLIVRKYKNRRLYDTEQSTHITREELLAIVKSGRNVQVQEAKTGKMLLLKHFFRCYSVKQGTLSIVLSLQNLSIFLSAPARTTCSDSFGITCQEQCRHFNPP